jgi:hypothetical protein
MKLTKLQVAEVQLERAISLFFEEKDFISSITLAGAADEIFGKLREAEGESNSYNELNKLFTFLRQSMLQDRPSGKEFNRLVNGIRNSLKHIGDGKEMEFDPEQEAVNIIDRAIENYFALTGNESELMGKFKYYQLRPSYPVEGA